MSKFRKLLRKAIEQYTYRSITYDDEYVRTDKCYWIVEEVYLHFHADFRSLVRKVRFKTKKQAEAYISDKYWRTVTYNIERLRKKYHKPSKSK